LFYFVKIIEMEQDDYIAVRVDVGTKQSLQKLADKNNRKLSDYCRLVLQEAIKKNKKV